MINAIKSNAMVMKNVPVVEVKEVTLKIGIKLCNDSGILGWSFASSK